MCSEFLGFAPKILHDIIRWTSGRFPLDIEEDGAQLDIKSPLQQEDGIIVKMKGKGDVWNLIVDSDLHCCIHLPCWYCASKTSSIIVKGLLAAVCASEDC